MAKKLGIPDFSKVKAFDAFMLQVYLLGTGSIGIVLNDLRTDNPISDAMIVLITATIMFMTLGYERRFLYTNNGSDGTNA